MILIYQNFIFESNSFCGKLDIVTKEIIEGKLPPVGSNDSDLRVEVGTWIVNWEGIESGIVEEIDVEDTEESVETLEDSDEEEVSRFIDEVIKRTGGGGLVDESNIWMEDE